ncbi:MAG: DUF6273 domain-containing protein [Lachnospiraceae bacterium]|nr:DUF6273 domain-containing protein [Lachnospiraceae bacterium]
MADNKIICESQEVLYQKAVKKMNADRVIVQHAYKIENYQIAAGMFDEVGDFEDAAELAARCRKLAAQTREEEKEEKYRNASRRIEGDPTEDIWKKAEAEFASLGDYKDSAQQTLKCREKLDGINRKYRRKRNVLAGSALLLASLVVAGSASGFFKYMLGWGMVQGGMYNQALEILETKSGFLSADSLADQCRDELIRESRVGDEVYFGRYKWKVLDREDDVITAITSAVSEDHDFYSVAFDEQGGSSWETSSLRSWLNTTIYEEAFSERERGAILPVVTETTQNEQYGTQEKGGCEDHLTLLSAQQAEDYADILKSLGLNYWLRTPGHEDGTEAFVSAGRHQAMLYGYPTDSQELSVRAVIRIDCAGLK